MKTIKDLDNSNLIISNVYIMGSIISTGIRSWILLLLGFIWLAQYLIFNLRKEE